jgi:hypothetical protein
MYCAYIVLKDINCCSRFSELVNCEKILKHLSLYFCYTFKNLHTLTILTCLLLMELLNSGSSHHLSIRIYYVHQNQFLEN